MNIEEFNSAVKQFFQISNSFNDGWKLKETVEYVYLVKIETRFDNSCDHVDPLSSCSGEYLQSNILFSRWEYHIVYNLSYQVPVLYFNAWKPSGQLLTVDEIINQIPAVHKDQISSDRWGTLTQCEHPYLRKPFYQLHPCKTQNVLCNIGNGRKTLETFVMWLSSFGPAVGLSIPLLYGKTVKT